MPSNKPREPLRLQAAVFDHDSGQMRRIEPAAKPELMPADHVLEALEGLGLISSRDRKKSLTEHVTLSARHPWVEGKGWLDVLNARSYYADSLNIGWIPEPGQPQGHLEIWLDGLAPNTGYLAEIFVSSVGAGVFEVRAVSGGVVTVNVGANGGDQSLALLFDTAEGGLGLIRVSNPDWVFHHARVSSLG